MRWTKAAEQILLLNNDTTVAPQILERLLDAANAYPDFGIVARSSIQ